MSSKAYTIRPLRKQHRIFQRPLAVKLGLSEGELGKIESGLMPVTDEYAETILAALQEMIEEKERGNECQSERTISALTSTAA